MRAGRGAAWWAGGLGVVLLGGLAAHLGWFAAPRPWPRATGWDRLPAGRRPAPASRVPGIEDLEIHWLGHSGFLLRWRGVALLLDPNLSPWCTVSRRVLEPAVAAAELGAVDAVLLSHPHYDHLDMPTLEGLGAIGTLVLPSGSEAYLRGPRWAGQPLAVLRPGGSARVGEVEIVAVPAAHNGSRFHPLASRRLAVGYVLRAGDRALYYAGDTGLDNDFAALRAAYRPDVAILPIGAYLPAFPLQRYHLSPEQAVEVGARLGVAAVVPCHFGTFTLSLDRPADALPRFAAAARARGLHWVMPRLLTEETKS